jgi:hypothetical protein
MRGLNGLAAAFALVVGFATWMRILTVLSLHVAQVADGPLPELLDGLLGIVP